MPCNGFSVCFSQRAHQHRPLTALLGFFVLLGLPMSSILNYFILVHLASLRE